VWRKDEVVYSGALVPGTYTVDAQLSDAGYVQVELSETPASGSVTVYSDTASETLDISGVDFATGSVLFDNIEQIVVSQAAGGTFTIKVYDPSGKQCTALNRVYSSIRCRLDRERERWSLEPYGRGEAEKLRMFVGGEDIRVGDYVDVKGVRYEVIEGPYVTYDRTGEVHHKTLIVRRADG